MDSPDCDETNCDWVLAICYDEKPARGVAALRAKSEPCCSRCSGGALNLADVAVRKQKLPQQQDVVLLRRAGLSRNVSLPSPARDSSSSRIRLEEKHQGAATQR